MSSFVFIQRVLVCVVVFFAAFGLSCKPKSTEQADANKPQPAPAKIEAEAKADVNLVEPQAPEEPAGSVAVTVNGADITEAELQKLLKPQLERMAQQGKQLPPAFAQTLEKQLRQHVLDRIIIGRLLDEKAKEANIVVTEEEAIKQITELAAAQRPPLSLEEFKKKTAEYGQNFDELKQQARKGMTYRKVMEVQWAGKINITEEDAKKHYDENPTKFEVKEQVRASHILITPDTTDPDADPNQAKAKIQDLLEQIKDGADFAELAKANSDGPSAARGGDLDFFPRGKMAPPFEKAAFELEVGKVSDIVETRFGYHIIKVTGHKDAGTTSFEQARDNIIKQLTQKKQSEFSKKYLESLKAEANIVYPPGKEPTPLTPAPVLR
ncbi:MAG: peptidylprolyl isomerase [Planctomycetes bacterium]|nr:peptidylprolyl isomerase [Planctomycetota bacterium]MCH8118389.1 peptidylprolyl isomerase [Planctomycetota bacterium]